MFHICSINVSEEKSIKIKELIRFTVYFDITLVKFIRTILLDFPKQ